MENELFLSSLSLGGKLAKPKTNLEMYIGFDEGTPQR